MSTETETPMVDILVIGGGPAGMFATFYCGMRQASVKLIENMPQLGGQLAALYPEKHIFDVAGFSKITAQDLVGRLEEQMGQFNPEVLLDEKVINVEKQDERHFVVTTNKGVHHAKSVIITAGVGAFEPKRIDLPEAGRFEAQKQLHYFVNDLSQFAGHDVVVNGGGDSAVDWALMLEPVAKSVTIVHRRNEFRAHEHSVEKLQASKVIIKTPYEIVGLVGETDLTGIKLSNRDTKEEEVLNCDTLIVNFGFKSSIGEIADWGLNIEKGNIIVDSKMETNIPGIFAAGDIATYPGKVKLIIVGLGEAPTAVNNAKVYADPKARLSPGHSSSTLGGNH
jgi:thioredoxin reductase (NADPH)